MASLAEVFNREFSPQLADLYWDALKGLPIEQLVEATRYCIRHHKHFPKPADLCDFAKDAQYSAPKPIAPQTERDPKWLELVNSNFLKYLLRRRIDEGFTGDLNIHKRRCECAALAEFFAEMEREGDPEATEAQMRAKFESAMGRIHDLDAA